MPDLLQCPFCGGDAAFGVSVVPEHDGGHYIQCQSCLISTGLVYPCGDDPKPILAERWNRRESPSHFQCPECGPTSVDEACCCTMCGYDCVIVKSGRIDDDDQHADTAA